MSPRKNAWEKEKTKIYSDKASAMADAEARLKKFKARAKIATGPSETSTRVATRYATRCT